MLKVTEIGKEFQDKVALSEISLIFPDKGLVIIKGESGSGKTTLLNLLSALDYPSSGCIEYDGVEITSKNSESYRKKKCSNIYQDYMLIEDMTAGENIELALQAYGESYTEESIKALLQKVNLPQEYIAKQASKLSGGEKQRVSIARAIAKKDAIIFADEPTGNLDSQNGETVMQLLKEISSDRLVIVVSHNESFNARYADYTIEIVDGIVENSDLPNEESKEGELAVFDGKSRLKAKTFLKLAKWGFNKNKAKTVASVVTLVILSIFSVVFSALGFSDLNLAYAKSIDKCQSKNLITDFYYGSPMIIESQVKSFEENLGLGFSEMYSTEFKFNLGERDDKKQLQYDEKYYNFSPYTGIELLYNEDIGIDAEVLFGDFPKEYDEVMLPYCYAKYIADVYIDYKTDDVKNLVGRTVKYGYSEEDSYDFKICGIFEEGTYYTDYDYIENKEIVKYYYETNRLARCAIFSPLVKDIWRLETERSKFVRIDDNFKINDTDITPYGYNKYREYAKDYAPLEYGEVYISKKAAESENIKIGDTLTNTQYFFYNYDSQSSEIKNFDGLIVKDTLDLPYGNLFIIFSEQYFIDKFVADRQMDKLEGFYFNLKDVKDSYGFLCEMINVGIKEDIWRDYGIFDTDYSAYAENIYVTPRFYEVISLYRALVFLPLALISIIGMAAMGFVTIGYIIESKGNSFNILRSIGFGKKNITAILAAQVFVLLIAGLLLGIGFGALFCHIFGRLYLKSKLGVAASLASEVILPMGYIAPLIVTAVTVLLGAAIVIIKIKSLYSKSISKNRQTE